MTLEHAVICGAQIAVTVIVAPLGIMAIAANAFAVTAESICYMPGYRIGDAATTLVGQSYGAQRMDVARRFGYITVGLGMVMMTVMGVIMYVCAPWVMELMTPVGAIRTLGVESLRIEAFAEPMFAAAIVSYGVMVGVGDTIVPACMNFGSIRLVRLPLAALLAPTMGLAGGMDGHVHRTVFPRGDLSHGVCFQVRGLRRGYDRYGYRRQPVSMIRGGDCGLRLIAADRKAPVRRKARRPGRYDMVTDAADQTFSGRSVRTVAPARHISLSRRALSSSSSFSR